MNKFKKLWPIGLIILICSLIYYEFVFLGKVPLPADTLVGAYFPWLDYKWGYIVGIPVKNAITSDAFSQFFVWKKIMTDSYLQGIAPLWNPFSFIGNPLLSTFETSALNPANILLFIPKMGWGLYIFSSSLAAFLSMYIFLGNYVSNRLIRIISSIIFAFAGPMTTWAEFGTAVWAAAALPLILHFIRQSLKRSKPSDYIFVSLLITFLIFAGHVQLLEYTFVLIPIYIYFVLRKEQSLFSRKKLLILLFSVVIGIGIGSIQLLPSYDFFGRSIRSAEKYAEQANFGLTPIQESARLVAADLFGHPARGNDFTHLLYRESYIGAISVPLIIFLLVAIPIELDMMFFLILFIGSGLLAIDNPISRATWGLPLPLITYSSASRLFFITGFSASALVAISLDKLKNKKQTIKPLAIGVMLVILYILVSILPVEAKFRSVSIRNSIVYIGLLLTFLTSSFLLRNHRRLLIWAILLVITLDFSRYFQNFNTFVKSELVFPETPILEFLQGQPSPFRIVRENTALLPPNTWAYYGLESIEGYDPLYSADYARFFHVVKGSAYTDAVNRFAILGDTFEKKWLDALNVKYILSVLPDPGLSDSEFLYQLKQSDMVEIKRIGHVAVYQNLDALNRAFFVDKVTKGKDLEDVYRLISQKDFDPSSEAVILDDLPGQLAPGSNQVISLDQNDGLVTITTKNKDKGFLVVSNSFDPGWKAKINGQPVHLYQVDTSLIGLLVPPGDNIIELQYLPDSFMAGAKISLISLATLPLLHYLAGRLKKNERKD